MAWARGGLDRPSAPLCGPLGLTALGRPIFWPPNVFSLLTAKTWEVDREEGRRASLALEVGPGIGNLVRSMVAREAWYTQASGKNAGAQGLPALFALWPSPQERGRFGSTQTGGGRTLPFSGHSGMGAKPHRMRDKFLLQVR